MVGERAASGGVGSIALAVLVSVAAPAVGYAVVRNAAIDAAGPASDPTGTLPPRSIVHRMKTVLRGARRPEEPLPRGAMEIAKRGAIEAPLSYEPYFIAARGAEQAGRYTRATMLMEEARRRRPNSTSVRVALLGYYSLADAYQKAIDEADMAMRISGGSTALILPAFAKLVGVDPKARQAIAASLAKDPPWRGAFLDVAATSKMDPDVARALVADVRRLAPSTAAGPEEAFLIRALAQAGRYREARTLWESFTPESARETVVTDGDFKGTKALAPFAWTFGSGAEGSAEIIKGDERGSIEVDYFGGGVILLAEQTLAAQPGNYQLTTLLTGEGEAADLQLAWEMICLPAGRPIAMLPLQPFGPGVFRRERPVTIPAAGCAGQLLTLVGRPGEVSSAIRAQITEVALTPVGRSRR